MAEVTLTGVEKRFAQVHVIKNVDLSIAARRVLRVRRPVRLREVDAAPADRRPGGRHLGNDPHRRPRRDAPAAGGARGRDGLPVLRALSAHEGRRQHHLRPEDGAGREGGDRQAAAARHEDAAARAAPRPQAGAAFRRPAPARRHRPRHRARPAGLPVRRAACPTSTQRFGARCASRSPGCTRSSARP